MRYGEEFMLQYDGIEYHLAFHDDGKKAVAEFNIGTPEKGYLNLEYRSAIALLENARINGKSIREMWEYLIVS